MNSGVPVPTAPSVAAQIVPTVAQTASSNESGAGANLNVNVDNLILPDSARTGEFSSTSLLGIGSRTRLTRVASTEGYRPDALNLTSLCIGKLTTSHVMAYVSLHVPSALFKVRPHSSLLTSSFSNSRARRTCRELNG